MKSYCRLGIYALITSVLMFASACTTTRTTVRAADSVNSIDVPTEMYPLTSEEADQVIVKSMIEQFDDVPLIRVDAPYKGYTVHTILLLDSHRFTARMIPAKGQLQNGKIVDGYIFEVIDAGTVVISGPIRGDRLIKRLHDNAKLIAEPIPIVGDTKSGKAPGAPAS